MTGNNRYLISSIVLVTYILLALYFGLIITFMSSGCVRATNPTLYTTHTYATYKSLILHSNGS